MQANRLFWGITVQLALLALAACSVAPPVLIPPELPAFSAHVEKATESDRESYNHSWWRSFELRELDELIEEAGKGNFTVQAAALRLKEAQGQDSATIWSLLPKASIQLTESEGAITQYQVNGYPNPSATGGIHPTSRGAVSMSWELPLFGKASATTALGVAQVELARWTLEEAKDTVNTELALSYVEALGTESMYVALEEARDTARTLVSEEATLRDAGMSSQSDVDRLEGQALDADSQLLEVQNRLATLRAKLGTLIGNPHSSVVENLSLWRRAPNGDTIASLDAVIGRLQQHTRVDAVGMRHRFDVKIAEAKVAQAAAQSGLATANLYPQFSLEGALNLAKGSLDSTGVTKGFSSIGNLDLGLRIPLLDWFALKADSVAKKTELQAVVMDYRATVLAAWEEATSTSAEASMALRQSQMAARQELLARGAAARQDAAVAKQYVAAKDGHQAHAAHSAALKAKIQAETNFLLSWARLRKAAGGWLS
jgi:outer membrane protein TolC